MEDFGFLGFLKFAAYYVVFKAMIQLYHLYARQNDKTVAAGVSGLFA